jgi:hypothetical protein
MNARFQALPVAVFCLLLGQALPGAGHLSAARLPSMHGPSAARPQTATGASEQGNLVLDEWFTRQGYSAKDSEFDLVYVNGGNNLENIKTPDDLWKVRLIEEDFHHLMFDVEGT